MSNTINTFNKQGGFSLIKNYIRNHVLLYSIFTFLLVPKNTKGLEIFRECVNLKIFYRIKRRYKSTIDNYILSLSKTARQSNDNTKYKSYIENEKNETIYNKEIVQETIWFCWFQGLEVAPPLVQMCYKSIKMYCAEYKTCVITSDNFAQYVDIPDYIIQKWHKGVITHAHFSDILRTALLVKNGGIWIDSTVLLTGNIPVDIQSSSLFFFRTFKPGCNGKSHPLSSWFIKAEKDNIVLTLVQKLLYEYWKSNNSLCDYFLFHIFVQISLDVFIEETKKIPKYTNETPHFMLFELGNLFVKEKWDSIIKQSFCHKLTNKLDEKVKQLNGTFYKKILEEI